MRCHMRRKVPGGLESLLGRFGQLTFMFCTVLALATAAAGCADPGSDDDASNTGDDDATHVGDDDATHVGDDDATGGDDDATGGDDDATGGDDDATGGDDDATGGDDDASNGDDDATNPDGDDDATNPDGDDDASNGGDDDASNGGDDDATVPTGDQDHDGQTVAQGDCDDLDPTVYTGAEEICDQQDNNCNGQIDEGFDQDGDGYTAEGCQCTTADPTCGADCNDFNANINPAADEICDGLDNDCDGLSDEGFDHDQNGIPDCLASEVCDGLDNNANGQIDEGFDQDGDGYTTTACQCQTSDPHCGTDCQDGDGSVNPGASESCNGQDDNCDGEIDPAGSSDAQAWYKDADGDGHGTAQSSQTACYQPTGYVASSDDCNDADAGTYPGALETCDGRDNNCNTQIDEGVKSTFYADADGDGHGNGSSTVQACTAPTGYVASSDDCNDGDAAMYPGNPEVCDGKDNDCDSQVDEGATNASSWYADTDGDGHGAGAAVKSCGAPTGYVASSDDCLDSDKTVYPGAAEVCDAKDNNCDGVVDGPNPVNGQDWYQDLDADTWGNPAVHVNACQAPEGYVDNGLDCDDTDPSVEPGVAGCPWPTGSELSCKDILDDGENQGDGYYEIDPDGKGVYTVYCDMTTSGGGWTLVGRLYAGTRSYTSINRTGRFFHSAWIQNTTTFTPGSNQQVVLGGSTYGMLDSVSLFDLAGQLRFSCNDTTRKLFADAIWPANGSDINAWLETTNYASAPAQVQFAKNTTAYTPASVYPTADPKDTWGCWHICGGCAHVGDMVGAFQLGVCGNSPTEADSNLTNINQIAIGFHDGFTGLRLECTADTPSTTSNIEGDWKAWVR